MRVGAMRPRPRATANRWQRALVILFLGVLLVCPSLALAETPPAIPTPVEHEILAEGAVPEEPEIEYRHGRPDEWLTHRNMPSFDAALAEYGDIPIPEDGAFDYAHYATAAEIESLCLRWQSEYPELVSVIPLGTSWQGRALYAVRLGNQVSGNPDARPALYIDASHHAREPISGQVALYTCWWLLSRYAQDAGVRHLLDTRTLYVIPMINPDGNDIWLTDHAEQRRSANPSVDDDGDGQADEDPVENEGYGSHRRYHYCLDGEWVAQQLGEGGAGDVLAPGWQSHVVSQTFLGRYDAAGMTLDAVDQDGDGLIDEDPVGGVDLNRNYDCHWESADPNPASLTYRGPESFSEPETRAVRDLALAHENIAAALTLHSGIDMIIYPWAWTQSEASPRAAQLHAIARRGSELTACNGYVGSRYGQASVVLYGSAGTTADWLHELAVYSWTVELYGADDYFPAERIDESNCFVIKRSLAARFVPEPADILPLVDRWRRFLIYVLAAIPNASVTRVEVDAESLWLQVANDGYLPIDVAIKVESLGVTTLITTCAELSAERRWVSVSRALCAATGTTTVTLSAVSTIGEWSRTIETLELRLHTINGRDGAAVWIEGETTPWQDLAVWGNGSWRGEWLVTPPGVEYNRNQDGDAEIGVSAFTTR